MTQTIKGGARVQTIFDSIEDYTRRGYTLQEAIEEVEKVLRCKLPENIVELIKQKY